MGRIMLNGKEYAGSDMDAYQPKTMSASVTVDGSSKSTVESAISGLADLANNLGLTVINGQVYQTVEEE